MAPSAALRQPGSRLEADDVAEGKLTTPNVKKIETLDEKMPLSEGNIFPRRNLALNWQHYEPVESRNFVNSLPPAEREVIVPLLNRNQEE